jgi:hypothetical protein
MSRWLPFGAVLVLAAVACSDTAGPEPAEELPALLSDIDMQGAIDFTPAWVLWSNGLEKKRQILLPPGGRIDISNRQHWVFPDGTRILKWFSVREPGGNLRHVETRILWLHNGQWETGAYVWNAGQTDAELVESGAPVAVSVTNESGLTFSHTVPGRSDCQSCHGSSPAFVLGFRELQLNRDNQLAALEARGIFTASPTDPDRVQAADSETEWVLGYVTANCVHCHNGSAEFDLSHGGFLDATVGRQGPRSGKVLITPGDPSASWLFARFQNREMPPLGVQLRDDAAVERLRAWILALETP